MKKNFKAVYEFRGEEFVIKTPISLGLIGMLQLALLGDEIEKELTESDEDVFDASYDFLEEQSLKLFMEHTGFEGNFAVAFKIPQPKDDFGFRVEIIDLEDQEKLSLDENSVTIIGNHRSVEVVKRGNSNVIHIKSLTEEFGKEAGVKHFLSDDEEVKNSVLALSDDALVDLTQSLINYTQEILKINVQK